MESGNRREVVRRTPTMVDVLDRLLDKGIVIDARVSVSVVGLQIATVDTHIVIASIETYLGHVDRFDRAGPSLDSATPFPDERLSLETSVSWDPAEDPGLEDLEKTDLPLPGAGRSPGTSNRIADYLASDDDTLEDDEDTERGEGAE